MSKITIVGMPQNEYVQKAKGGYNVLTVNFRDDSGKTTARKIFSFVAKDVYGVLKDAKPNEVYEVSEAKNDKDYLEFTSAKLTNEKPATTSGTPSAGTTTPKSNYESAEERTARQVLIVRQSSVSSAISLLTLQGEKKATVDTVLGIARQLEDFVYGRTEGKQAAKTVASASDFSDMADDVPM